MAARASHKLKISSFFIAVFILSACGVDLPAATPTLAPTDTLPVATITPSLSTAAEEAAEESAAGELTATVIVTVANDDGSPRPVLRNAMWTEDSRTVIYTLSTLNGQRRFAYDLSSGETQSLSATFPQEARAPLLSPSGQYQLVVDTRNFPSPEPGDVLPPFELWLVNNTSGERSLLFPEARGQAVVNWTADESRFVLSLDAFGEGYLYIGNTESAEVAPLQDFANHSGWTYYGWSLSPDGENLAIASEDFTQLQVIDLNDGGSSFGEGANAAFFSWSADSQRVYYKALSKKPEVEFDGYYVYDLESGQSELLLTQDMLRELNLCLESCYFVPSPDGQRVLIGWGDYAQDYLWVAELP